jgi:hypothetical protein
VANAQLETALTSINNQFLVLDYEWRYLYHAQFPLANVAQLDEAEFIPNQSIDLSQFYVLIVEEDMRTLAQIILAQKGAPF